MISYPGFHRCRDLQRAVNTAEVIKSSCCVKLEVTTSNNLTELPTRESCSESAVLVANVGSITSRLPSLLRSLQLANLNVSEPDLAVVVLERNVALGKCPEPLQMLELARAD